VPTVAYTGNAVTLTLLNTDFQFQNTSFTGNQGAVGNVLTQASPTATGDFANVLNFLSALDSKTLSGVLDQISGQNYSGFGTATMQSIQIFMDNFQFQAGAGQTFGSKVASAGRSTHVELAEACDVSCDTTSGARWGAWGGGVGAFGTVAGDTNSKG